MMAKRKTAKRRKQPAQEVELSKVGGEEAGFPAQPTIDTAHRAERPERGKLTAEEILKRMQEFPKRKERFIASVRKGKNRGLSA
jgi:hypothetical protein